MKKKELCILHIGMPKTGTSTIQKNLFMKVEDPRVHYASFPQDNHSGPLLTMFMDDPTTYHYANNLKILNNINEVNKKNIAIFTEGLNSHPGSIEIISGEDLFHLDPLGKKNDSIKLLKNFLLLYFEKIIVVAYVRKPSSLLASAFQQLVKYHDLGSLNHSIYHRYMSFKKYMEIFGESNVRLFNFEPENFDNGDILLDFTTRLGLKPQKSIIKIVNESISKGAISILFTYHFHKNVKTNFYLNYNRNILKLVNLLCDIDTEKLKFSGPFIESIITTYQSDYDWIVSKMGDGFKETTKCLSADGVDNGYDLMRYSVQFIPKLIEMSGKYAQDLEIDDSPQTVARLADKIMIRIDNDYR